MMYQKFLGIFALITAISILVGCAPKPRVDIYMEPVADAEQAQVDAQTGSITAEQKGVRVTLGPLDEVELFELTEDARINPYIAISRGGNVEPLYTVLGISIENTGNSRVVVDPTAILIDQNGEQYASLPYDYFKDLYDNVRPQTVAFHDIGYRYYYPYPRSYYRSLYRYHYRYPYRYSPRVYDYHPDLNAANHSKMVVHDTVFDGGKLFSGAKRDGLLAFDRLDIGATDVKVILPEVLVIDKRKKEQNSISSLTFGKL